MPAPNADDFMLPETDQRVIEHIAYYDDKVAKTEDGICNHSPLPPQVIVPKRSRIHSYTPQSYKLQKGIEQRAL